LDNTSKIGSFGLYLFQITLPFLEVNAMCSIATNGMWNNSHHFIEERATGPQTLGCYEL